MPSNPFVLYLQCHKGSLLKTKLRGLEVNHCTRPGFTANLCCQRFLCHGGVNESLSELKGKSNNVDVPLCKVFPFTLLTVCVCVCLSQRTGSEHTGRLFFVNQLLPLPLSKPITGLMS